MAASHGPPGRWGRFPRSRRRRLPLLIVAGLLLAAVGGAHGAAAQGADGTPTPTNPIVRENALPGDRDWYVSQPAQSTATGIAPDEEDESGERPAAEVWVRAPLEGYADRTSVERGGTLGFYVSSTAPRFDLTVSRMGWYGGAGGRAVHRVAGLRGEVQPLPPPDPATGLVAAEWRLSYSLRIPEDWTSGVYIARLRAVGETIDEAQIVFVVRHDEQIADFVYKLPVNTYQAYNNWGGKSVYAFNSSGDPALKVSFDRPYALRSGAGHFFHWDYSMIRWLEREGYNVSYITDIDAQTSNDYLPGRRALLSVGHDEYWSKELRDNWEAARNAGYSLGFFGANNAYWQVRYEPSARGVANRVLVCYKRHAPDPIAERDPRQSTVVWREAPVSRPENALLGPMFEGQISIGENYPFVVKTADHWAFDGTDAEAGQAWSRIVGYEYDRVQDNGQTPAGLIILAESPIVDVTGKASVAHATYYRQGGMVFAAGTVDWSWGLDDYWQPDYVDPRVQRMTANLLAAFRAGVPPGTPAPGGGGSREPLFIGAGVMALVAAVLPLYVLVRRARDHRA